MLFRTHDLAENRYPLFGIMLFRAHDLAENRYPLFGIMLEVPRSFCAIGAWPTGGKCSAIYGFCKATGDAENMVET
jgi:hypothetical protein